MDLLRRFWNAYTSWLVKHIQEIAVSDPLSDEKAVLMALMQDLHFWMEYNLHVFLADRDGKIERVHIALAGNTTLQLIWKMGIALKIM